MYLPGALELSIGAVAIVAILAAPICWLLNCFKGSPKFVVAIWICAVATLYILSVKFDEYERGAYEASPEPGVLATNEIGQALIALIALIVTISAFRAARRKE